MMSSSEGGGSLEVVNLISGLRGAIWPKIWFVLLIKLLVEIKKFVNRTKEVEERVAQGSLL